MSAMMNNKDPKDFTFEEWQELYQSDPEKFEEMREDVIYGFLDSLPDKNKQILEKFQWRIDMERKRSKNPLQACIKMNEMLMKHFYSENGLYKLLERLSEKTEAMREREAEKMLSEDNVISLPLKRRD